MSRAAQGVGALALGVGLALALAPRPPIDNSVEAISATDGRRAETYRAFRRRFGGDEVIAVRVKADTATALAEAVERVRATLRRFAPTERLLTPADVYPDEMAIMGDPELFDAATRARVETTLAGPLGRGLRLLTLEPPAATLYAFGRTAAPSVWAGAEAELAELARALSLEGVEMVFSGSPLLNLALDREGARVERFALPVLVVVCVLVLLALLRSVRMVACVLVPVGLGVLGAEGAFGLIGETSNLVVNVAKPLLFVILLASSLHVVVAFEVRFGATPQPGRGSAAWGAAKDKARGVALALLTTAIGFSSLALADVIPIRSFGLLCAGGLAAGGPLVLFGLPLLLSLFGPRRPGRSSVRSGGAIEDYLERAVDWAQRRERWVIGAALGLVLGGLLTLPRLEPSTHTLEYFPDTHPIRVAHAALDSSGVGLMTLEVVVRGDDVSLEALDAFASTATSAPEVRGRLDLPLVLREAHDRAVGLDRVPDPATAETYLEERPELAGALRVGTDHRVALFVRPSSGEDLDLLSSRLRVAHARLLPGTELILTGTQDLIIRSQQSLLDTLIFSLALTLVLMELVVWAATRSFRLALVALLPNLVPVAVNILLLFTLGLPLDVGTAMTGAVALGIAVDDTLHFLVAWQEEGTRSTIRRTGRAIVMSTAVIATGFFALVPSAFLPTRNFSLLTGAAITAALFADLLVLPPLLRRSGLGVDRACSAEAVPAGKPAPP